MSTICWLEALFVTISSTVMAIQNVAPPSPSSGSCSSSYEPHTSHSACMVMELSWYSTSTCAPLPSEPTAGMFCAMASTTPSYTASSIVVLPAQYTLVGYSQAAAAACMSAMSSSVGGHEPLRVTEKD